jgi:regulator of chromosome condensation
MDSRSPRQEKEMAGVSPQKEETQEMERVVAPQNTLLNLAKLNIGTPRFEVNSAANEENAEEIQDPNPNVAENGGTSNVQEAEVQESARVTENHGDVAEEHMTEPKREIEAEVQGGTEGVINGAPKVEEKIEMLEVPEDELMRITGEDVPAKSVGGGEEEQPQQEKQDDTPKEGEVHMEEEVRAEEEVQVEEKEAPVMEETVPVEEPQTETTPVEIQEEAREENQIVEETPVEEPKEETPIEAEVDAVPEVEESAQIVEEEVAQPTSEPVQEIQEEVQEEAVAEKEGDNEVVIEEVTPVHEAEPVAEPEEEVREEVPVQEEEPEAQPEEVPQKVEAEPVVEIQETENQPEEPKQSEPEPEVQEPEPEEKQPEPEVKEPEPEPEVVEETIEIKPQSEESEKEEEENLETPILCTMPPPPSNPKNEQAAPEEIPEETAPVEETNKIEEEEPEAANPILVRNQQISEDEKEMEFVTSGSNKVYAWGSAECDQFECPQYESRRPVEIPYFSSNKVRVSKIVCGSQHTLLLDSTGKVYSWGNSDDGVLGRDVDQKSSEAAPGLVDLESQVDLISAGDAHSVFANSQTGELFFSGVIKSSNGKLSRVIETPESITINKFKKSGIKSILSGANHVLVHSRFNVYAFGDNSCGALGYILRTYDEADHCLQPHALRLKGIARVFTGAYHCFAITNKGILKTWGLNSQGQLGLPYYFENGEDSDVNHDDPNRNPNVLQLPHQVGNIDGNKIVDIVGGEHHSLMLMEDGSVWGAGRNDDGQLGGLVKPDRESYEEVRVPNSRVRVAGTNNYVMVTDDYMPNTFMRLPINKSFQEVHSRSHYNYAINREDSAWPKIYSWGSGFSYVLGNGNEDPLTTPFRISNQKLFKGNVPNQVALGFSHVVYFTGDSHDVELEEPKVRTTRKRDQMTPIKRKDRFKGKRVKSK